MLCGGVILVLMVGLNVCYVFDNVFSVSLMFLDMLVLVGMFLIVVRFFFLE